METTRLRPLTLDASAAAAPDRLYESFTDFCADRLGLTLYPHQDEAIVGAIGRFACFATPTGFGQVAGRPTAAIHAGCRPIACRSTPPR
ncbi:MAG: hypothetical protein R2742_10380 [Micropruina glycogenica]